MDPIFYLTITLLVLLVVVFIVSYVLNKRTPVPKGCEHLNISDEFCLNCPNKDCKIHERLNLEQIRKDLEEESEEKCQKYLSLLEY